MQTVIVPHEPEVRQQLDALSPRLREIARRYIERLRLEPFLGHRLERGLLATEEARAVYFDSDSRPDDFGYWTDGLVSRAGAAATTSPKARGSAWSTSRSKRAPPSCG